MFGMGWPEIGLVLVVALLVFGPDRLPGLARQAAAMVNTVRRMADDAKRDLTAEMPELDLRDLNLRTVVRDLLDKPEPDDVDRGVA